MHRFRYVNFVNVNINIVNVDDNIVDVDVDVVFSLLPCFDVHPYMCHD